jgi:hypothetical protein
VALTGFFNKLKLETKWIKSEIPLTAGMMQKKKTNKSVIHLPEMSE